SGSGVIGPSAYHIDSIAIPAAADRMSAPAVQGPSATTRVPWLPLVLLACGALALAGGLLHRHELSLAAAALLLLAWLPSVWRRRSVVALSAWLALSA